MPAADSTLWGLARKSPPGPVPVDYASERPVAGGQIRLT
jgi:hypothetical protein